MRLLLAGIDTSIAKSFIKNYKSKYGLVALDPSKADFSKYDPVKKVFSAYRFDAVVYFASGRGKELNLFKNLQYAAISFGVKKMLTVIIAEPGAVYDPLITVGEQGVFDSLAPLLIQKDKIGTALKFFDFYGKDEKDGIVAKMVNSAKKKGKITIEQDKQINLLHLNDATRILDTMISGNIAKGVYDVSSPNPTNLSTIAKAIKKHLPDTEVEILDRTLADGIEADIEPLLTAISDNFKFTQLGKGLGEMLIESVKQV